MLGPLEVGQRGAAQPAQEQGPVTKQAGPSLLWPAGPLASTATPFSSFLFKLYTAIRWPLFPAVIRIYWLWTDETRRPDKDLLGGGRVGLVIGGGGWRSWGGQAHRGAIRLVAPQASLLVADHLPVGSLVHVVAHDWKKWRTVVRCSKTGSWGVGCTAHPDRFTFCTFIPNDKLSYLGDSQKRRFRRSLVHIWHRSFQSIDHPTH